MGIINFYTVIQFSIIHALVFPFIIITFALVYSRTYLNDQNYENHTKLTKVFASKKINSFWRNSKLLKYEWDFLNNFFCWYDLWFDSQFGLQSHVVIFFRFTILWMKLKRALKWLYFFVSETLKVLSKRAYNNSICFLIRIFFIE